MCSFGNSTGPTMNFGGLDFCEEHRRRVQANHRPQRLDFVHVLGERAAWRVRSVNHPVLHLFRGEETMTVSVYHTVPVNPELVPGMGTC